MCSCTTTVTAVGPVRVGGSLDKESLVASSSSANGAVLWQAGAIMAEWGSYAVRLSGREFGERRFELGEVFLARGG